MSAVSALADVASPRDHDLAVGLALLDVGHRLESLLERERAVEDWTQHAVVVERRQPLELRPTGLHEEERVGDPEPLGLPADLAADQGHHGSQERLPDLSGESGVGRPGDADRDSTTLQ